MNNDIKKNSKVSSSSLYGQQSVDKKTSAQDVGKNRQARLEDALRANLRKRKQQARARGKKMMRIRSDNG